MEVFVVDLKSVEHYSRKNYLKRIFLSNYDKFFIILNYENTKFLSLIKTSRKNSKRLRACVSNWLIEFKNALFQRGIIYCSVLTNSILWSKWRIVFKTGLKIFIAKCLTFIFKCSRCACSFQSMFFLALLQAHNFRLRNPCVMKN